jgi:hypothetical protein
MLVAGILSITSTELYKSVVMLVRVSIHQRAPDTYDTHQSARDTPRTRHSSKPTQQQCHLAICQPQRSIKLVTLNLSRFTHGIRDVFISLSLTKVRVATAT